MIYDKHTAALIEVSISRGNSQSGILHHIPPPCSKLNIPCRNESRFQYMQRLHRTTGRKGFLQRLVLNSLPFCSFIPMVTSDLTICNVTLPTGLVKQETPEDQCKLDSCHSTPSTSRIEVKMKGRGEEKEYLIFMADTAGDSSLLPVLPKSSLGGNATRKSFRNHMSLKNYVKVKKRRNQRPSNYIQRQVIT
ncbi:uncharacterized protein LOC129701640 isoform X2 [Leucoraja erinacea]|uniref:uncharacterized protein LOC129701640 isoform X2 n=1 Tax=Leucoraja erinaceus TaxID=7782 RepID=UPI0024541362|nr:uncharacterized protein LOC129701640 isoform X2 [Leucoraja erinacea]